MTPEQALEFAAKDSWPATDEFRFRKAQLVLTAELLKETRRLREYIEKEMPTEPIRIL